MVVIFFYNILVVIIPEGSKNEVFRFRGLLIIIIIYNNTFGIMEIKLIE